jgi:hypothetical protein
MTHNPSEQPEKRKLDQDAEVDRYERLQLAAERHMKGIQDAYETHASLLRTVVVAVFALAGVIATLIGFGSYHSASEFKQNMRDNLNTTLENMTRTLDTTMSEMTNRVEGKISEENTRIDDGIDERFKRDNIEPLIEKKVDQVTSAIIAEAIRKQIDPRMEDLTNQMANVQDQLIHTKISSADMSEGLGLAMNTALALCDDRFAFDRLVKLEKTGTNKNETAVIEAINAVLDKQVEESLPFVQLQINWSVLNFDPDTNNWDAYMKMLGMPEPVIDAAVLQKLSEQQRFPMSRKYELYRNLLISTYSIKVLKKTCDIIGSQSHMNLNIMAEPQYLAWVDTQVISNCTAYNAMERMELCRYVSSRLCRGGRF